MSQSLSSIRVPAPDRAPRRPWRGARVPSAVVFCVLMAGIAGCREEEQDRPLVYEPGVYGGKQDTALTPEQQRELELRGRMQKF